MSTLDKDVYDRHYKAIEQTILQEYLTSDDLRWRTFYKYLTVDSLLQYERVVDKYMDPQVSIELNRKGCEHTKILITIEYDTTTG